MEETLEYIPGSRQIFHNDIVKPFRVEILQYAERVRKMHNLEKYLPPHLMKVKSFYSYSWDVRDK